MVNNATNSAGRPPATLATPIVPIVSKYNGSLKQWVKKPRHTFTTTPPKILLKSIIRLFLFLILSLCIVTSCTLFNVINTKKHYLPILSINIMVNIPHNYEKRVLANTLFISYSISYSIPDFENL